MGLFKRHRKSDDAQLRHLAADAGAPDEPAAPGRTYPDDTSEHLAEDVGVSTEEFDEAAGNDNSRISSIPPPPD